jgi:ParB-like chromosome segregation protein Spo0J
MKAIETKNISPQRKLFHNEFINVYPTTLALDKIEFWRDNNRTIFTFERLEKIKKKKIEELSIEEITEFIAEQDIHKLQSLASSIGRNGVQVPMIIRDDGLLLDGNRRFFACQWLKMQAQARRKPIPDPLYAIPVQVIRAKDLTETLELKILAEANFIHDLKVAWPLDAQARAVDDYYVKVRSKGVDHETALEEVVGVFGITRQRAIDLLDTLAITKRFIELGSSLDERIARRQIVEERFVYLWEFRNKAMKGRGALTSREDLEDVMNVFFDFMAKGRDSPITSLKQIEPLIQAKRDPKAWTMLVESKGGKLTAVVSAINEKKEVRKSEDRIRIFHDWLEEQTELPAPAKAWLYKVVEIAKTKLKN